MFFINQSKLESLRLGTPQVFKNLTIIPLFNEAPLPFDCLSLKSALDVGLGTNIRYDEQNIGVAALVYQESAVHITIFSKNNITDETRASDVRNEFNVGENLRCSRKRSREFYFPLKAC